LKRLLWACWLFFKWIMVAAGTVYAAAFTVSMVLPKPTQWRQIVAGDDGCLFAFQTEQNKWMPDTHTGTGGMIQKGFSGKSAVIYLSGTTFWSGRDENGGWATPIQRQCTIERRGTVTTDSGKPAPYFLASGCKKSDDQYANFGTNHLLYGYVNQGKQSHFLWFASDDKNLLLSHEGELKAILKSYSTAPPNCVTKSKPSN